MLYSIVVEIAPLDDGFLPPTHGHFAHAIFLKLISEVDAQTATNLHNSSGLRPFTVSPIQGRAEISSSGLALKAGQRFSFRFSLLDAQLFATFIARFLKEERTVTLRLGNVVAQVVTVHTQNVSNRLAGFTTFESLLDNAQSSRSIALRFLSPTAFSFGGGQNIVFPEPRLVFGSLLTKWNAFASEKLDKQLEQYLNEDLVVARYNLETRMLDFGRYRKVGFIGQCDYEVRSGEKESVLRPLNALADFALYSGVGYKTTMGMGQARRSQLLR